MAITSFSQYYQMLNKYIDCLKKTINTNEINSCLQVLIDTANKGLQIEAEPSDPYKVKAIADNIGQISTRLGPIVDVKHGNKTLQYSLPSITDMNSLLLAAVYYRHLRNYVAVEYCGPITTYWGIDAKSKIQASIERKKPWNKALADHLYQSIKDYCLSQKHAFDEKIAPLLDSIEPTFIKQLKGILTGIEIDKPDKLGVTEDDKTNAETAFVEKNMVLQAYEKQFSRFNTVSQRYLNAKSDYESQSFIVRFFSQLTQWIYPFNSKLTTYNKTKSSFDAQKTVLNKLTPIDNTYFNYFESLSQEVKQLQQSYEKVLSDYFKQANKTDQLTVLSSDVLQTQLSQRRAPFGLQAAKSHIYTKRPVTAMSFFRQNLPEVNSTCALTTAAIAATATVSATAYYMLS